MKATYIIVLINLANVCYSLYPMAVYTKDGKGTPTYCSSKLISKDDIPRAFSTDYCISLSCDDDDCFRCCYIHAKLDGGNTYRGCYPMTYAQYANASEIEPADLMYDGENLLNSSFTDFTIHCNSKYLTITASFIALMVALF